MARGTWRLTKPLQTPNTDEYSLGDSAPGANVRTQERNNPDRQLRSLILAKWETKWVKQRGQEEAEMVGHETHFYFNEVPLSKSEYESKVKSLIPEDVIKLITSQIGRAHV